jgi:hypothetical protein
VSPIVPRRILGGGVLAETTPIAVGAPEVYRGVDLGPTAEEVPSGAAAGATIGGPYRDKPAIPAPSAPTGVAVIVREATLAVAGAPEFLALFERVTLARHHLSGGPAPRLLRTLGRGTAVLVTVEETLAGVPLSRLVHEERRRKERMTDAVALAIGQALLPLWLTAERREIRFGLDPGAVILDPHGKVRALPELADDLARRATKARSGPSEGGKRPLVGGLDTPAHDPALYASPEEIRGEAPDARSGMFTLGLLLHEMLTGSHPLAAPGLPAADTLSAMAWQEMPSLRQRRRDLHPAAAALVQRCLSRAPERRFPSWRELSAAYAGVQALFPAAGPAEIGKHVRGLFRPGEGVPEIGPLDGWRRLPHAGYDVVPLPEALLREPAEGASSAGGSTAIAEPEILHARRDGKAMFVVGTGLLVDVRPVTRLELERFFQATREPRPAHLAPITAANEEEPCTYIPVEVAESYARWTGKRLPTEAEWDACIVALGAERLGTGAVWEWTASRHEDGGRVIRGGRWRDQVTMAPRPRNRSFAISAAPDLGFRCVAGR